ncbi:hypothetical protein BYT27DRAFT_7262475 [Phlegmacium glaucopus]|nr:hypothetical protein BYT27DRAFT_7262475 [Phlegmacium glaucopus]
MAAPNFFTIAPITSIGSPDSEGGRQRLSPTSSMAHAVPTSGSAATATLPETTTIQPPSLSISISPPAPAQLSTSPNWTKLTNPDEVDERLKRMKETFMRSLKGMGRGGEEVRKTEG